MNTTLSRLDTRELRAWRGLLRVHAQLSKALDAQLIAAHGLPLTSYEVLMYLSDAHDARGAFAVLTESGREKLEAARVTHLAGVRDLFLRHFSGDELDWLGD